MHANDAFGQKRKRCYELQSQAREVCSFILHENSDNGSVMKVSSCKILEQARQVLFITEGNWGQHVTVGLRRNSYSCSSGRVCSSSIAAVYFQIQRPKETLYLMVGVWSGFFS